MPCKLARVAVAAFTAVMTLPTVSHAKHPWKHYYKAQEKQEKAYWKFQRKQAHEWEKFERKRAKHWGYYGGGYGRYGW